MGTFTVCGQYFYGLQKITFTLCGNMDESFSANVISPNILSICDGRSEVKVTFEQLTFKPISCEIASDASTDIESFSVFATCSSKLTDDLRYSDLCGRLINGEALRCKFCEADIVNISDVTEVGQLLPVDSLASSEPNSFFCHSVAQVPEQTGTPLSRTVNNIPSSSALCNGIEMIFNADSWVPLSTQSVPGSEGVFCSRCRIMLGRLVGVGDDAVAVLWTNTVTVWTREVDIDGDYLRHVGLPLIQYDVDFFEFLLSQMLKNNCYRIILSAGTFDRAVDYALIWLFDQRKCLYTTTVDTSKVFSNCDGDNSTRPDTTEIVAERTPISTVLYKVLVSNKQLITQNSRDATLEEWSRDFSVSHLLLPLECCVMLTTFLTQVTRRLPPQLRCSEGFMVGGIPIRK
uniref:E3 ubiquitin-protein ligase E3D n=1 Tax=Mesocestoides corti TaxID=53468 RepID=A0A5K3FMA9_MESCO